MNMMIDTLEFAEAFEKAGFEHGQARALAAAFAKADEAGRSDLVTNEHLDTRLAELEGRFNKQLGEMEVRLTRLVGDVGKDVSNRLWSTVTIIAGVSTAVSATIAAGVALLLKWQGL